MIYNIQNSNLSRILVLAAIVAITMMMTSSYSSASNSSLIASSTENAIFLTGRDIKAGILGQLFASNVTSYEVHTNGTAIATFTGNHNGIKVYYNHSMTPETGHTFENGTIYLPDGRELRVLLG